MNQLDQERRGRPRHGRGEEEVASTARKSLTLRAFAPVLARAYDPVVCANMEHVSPSFFLSHLFGSGARTRLRYKVINSFNA